MLYLIGFGCLFTASEDVTLSATVADLNVSLCRGSQEIFVCGHVTPEMGRTDEKDKRGENSRS